MSDLHWNNSVTDVTSEKILVRGYPIEELMGNVTFAQAVWLTVMGEIPGEQLTNLIELILISSIDHGPAPPSCIAARTIASTGANLSASVAAGVMTINRHHGGAIEGCFLALDEALGLLKEKGLSFDDAAEALLKDYREQKKRIPGFGHQLLEVDPRTARLFEACEEFGFTGDHVKMVQAIQKAFEKAGKKMTLNIAGAIGAVLGDLGVPSKLMSGFFMIARVPGLVAHSYEEMTEMRPMRKIHPTEYGYNGPPERHL